VLGYPAIFCIIIMLNPSTRLVKRIVFMYRLIVSWVIIESTRLPVLPTLVSRAFNSKNGVGPACPMNMLDCIAGSLERIHAYNVSLYGAVFAH
jgi:hypothetical protein